MKSIVVLAALGGVLAAQAGTVRTDPAGAPPYYRGRAPPASTIAWLPVGVADGPEWSPAGALQVLARDLTARLARLESLVPALPEGSAPPPAGAPSAYVGCARSAATGDCDIEAPDMVFEIHGPSKAWRKWAAGALERRGADLLLVPTLQVADHWVAQSNLRGAKEVRLGTGYSQAVPWLTSLDTPAQVVQLGAVLVGRDGRVVRSGVEGIAAVRTEFAASVVGAQRILGEPDVERIRSALRRDDLPGTPLSWDAALDVLVRTLTGEAGDSPTPER